MTRVAAIAKVTAVEGKAEQALEALRELVDAAQEEPGTSAYALHVDAADPGVFWFYELYESEEAMSEHVGNLRQFRDRLAGLLAGAPEVHVLRPEVGKGVPL